MSHYSQEDVLAAGDAPEGISCSKLTLSDPVQKNGKTVIEVYAVYTNLTYPKPAEIPQGETQRVVYEGQHFIFSPYHIKSQTTKVAPDSVHAAYGMRYMLAYNAADYGQAKSSIQLCSRSAQHSPLLAASYKFVRW